MAINNTMHVWKDGERSTINGVELTFNEKKDREFQIRLRKTMLAQGRKLQAWSEAAGRWVDDPDQTAEGWSPLPIEKRL